MKKKINNYRFQQQQQAKQEYQKLKKVKETPEDATEELEYVKKLLSGEDVGDFVSKEPVYVEKTEDWGWMSTGSAMTGPQVQAQLLELMQHLQVGRLSLSEFLDFTTPIKTKGL